MQIYFFFWICIFVQAAESAESPYGACLLDFLTEGTWILALFHSARSIRGHCRLLWGDRYGLVVGSPALGSAGDLRGRRR